MDAELSAALAPEALAPPIARELGLSESAVVGVLRRLAAGDQPTFLNRYRREHTGNLTLRDLERVQARAGYAVAFEFKRAQLRQELADKDRLDEEIAGLLASAQHPVDLDDLRALLRKRKRGLAARARARGLGVLAGHLWACGSDGRMRGPDAGPSDADPLKLAVQHPGHAPPAKTSRRSRKSRRSKATAEDPRPGQDVLTTSSAPSAADADPASSGTDAALEAAPGPGEVSPGGPGTSEAEAQARDRGEVSPDAQGVGEVAAAAPGSDEASSGAPVAAEVAAAAPGSDEASSGAPVAAEVAATVPGSDEASSGAPIAGEVAATAGDSDEASSGAPVAAEAAATAGDSDEASSGAPVAGEISVTAPDPGEADPDAPGTGDTDAADAVAQGRSEANADAPAADVIDASAEGMAPSVDASGEAGDPARQTPVEPEAPRTPEDDLADARTIVAEEAFALPAMQRRLRELVLEHGRIRAAVVPGKKDKGGRYAKLAERVEPIARCNPSHILGLLRGEREGALAVSMEIDPEAFDALCDELLGIDGSRPCGEQLRQALHEGWLGPLGGIVRNGARKRLKQRVDRRAIGEFCDAYRPLLMAPAFGPRPLMAIDPGFAPGCKVAVLAGDGSVLARETVFPLQPKLQAPQAKARLIELAKEHAVDAIVVNNGGGGRDVERLAREAVRETEGLEALIVSGDSDTAGIYASSRLAKQRLPNDDASMRRAIASGRRLQDPLRELAKLDPRKLPLGQHQHEVDQEELRAALEQVMLSCVNEIGVELNESTADELARVTGFTHALAKAIAEHREANGPFPTRQALLEVPGVAGKPYEQGVGFLRVTGGEQPLDRTTIHPERYGLVTEMARDLGVTIDELVGNPTTVDTIDASRWLASPEAGDPPLGRATLDAILEQLRRPGADPRPAFDAVEFEPGVESFEDLEVGMELSGVVTHLANFGAFVDVGLREEALVHVSELTHGFISSPFDAVHVGQRVRGRVIEVSAERKRIALSLRALEPKPEGTDRAAGGGKRRRRSDGGRGDGPRRDGGSGRGKGRGGGRKGDRKGDRGGPGRGGAGKERGGEERVLGFKLDLSDLAERLGKG